MSLIVIASVVSTTVPLTLSILILMVKVSGPSVVESAVGVTVNDPVLLVIVKLPLAVPKSPELFTVQYNVVASVTLVVSTFIVKALPSSTLFAAGVALNVVTAPAGVVLVSLIVIASVVSTTMPLTLPVLSCIWNVSAPSVVESAEGVTVNEPVLLVIIKLPFDSLKSPLFVAVQYNVVASVTLVVSTFIVKALPSLILFAAGVAVYVGETEVLVSLIGISFAVVLSINNSRISLPSLIDKSSASCIVKVLVATGAVGPKRSSA